MSYHALRAQYASLLKRFIASTKEFEVLTSIPTDPSPPAETLYVLDSSFNPPTLAHLRIASSALQERLQPTSRLLLLLATQNADKPSKPASFEDRLIMMELFAHDLRSHLATTATSTSSGLAHPTTHLPSIDIGVTKQPYFVDKAAAIEAAGTYPTPLEQVHLTGYDTLIRILNPKYYPPEYNLQPLNVLFSRHRLRVRMRPDDEWGSPEDQQEFVAALARGDRENEGGRREWAERIHLVPGKTPGEPPVSSTKAREAVQATSQDLDWLVPDRVRDFMRSEQPYSGDR